MADTGIKDKLRACVLANFHVLCDAYVALKEEESGGFGPVPVGCQEAKAALVEGSDPVMEAVSDYLEEILDFTPVRDPVVEKGKRYFAFVNRLELVRRCKLGLSSNKSMDGILGKSKMLKSMVDNAMKRRGRSPITICSREEGNRKQEIVFDMVRYKTCA